VDTHDVMHVRSEVYRDQPDGAWVRCSRDEEIALLMRADHVMAIQQREADLLREMLPSRRVLLVPHVQAPATGKGERTSRSPRFCRGAADPVVAFVGSRIQGNVAGMTEFIERGWPIVREAQPRARLRVY